jgi:hypothetical protein
MEMTSVLQEKTIDKDKLVNQLYETASFFMPFAQCCDHHNNTEKSSLMYQAGNSIIDYAGRFDLDYYHKQTTTLINLMHTAKNNGITEDFMSKYAYNESKIYGCNKKKYCSNFYVPLVFGCLKQYIHTNSAKTRNNSLHPSTQAVIHITQSANQPRLIFPKERLKTQIIHPLTKSIVFLITTSEPYTLQYLTKCLYSGNIASYLGLNEQKTDPGITNFDEFYDAMNKILGSSINIDEIHQAIQLIEHVKTLPNIGQGLHISSIVLAHKKQEPQNIMHTIGSWFDNQFGYQDEIDRQCNRKKKLIAAFCTLAEEYNTARDNKKTPTSKQYFLYLKIMEHKIGLPDLFDTKIFNNKYYAFDEFSELVNDAVELCKETYPEKFYRNRSKMVQ